MRELMDVLTLIAKEKADHHRKQYDLWLKLSGMLPGAFNSLKHHTSPQQIKTTTGKTHTRFENKYRLNASEAAEYLGLSAGTLAVWRVRGEGPAYNKIGTRVMYSREVLDEYIQSRSFPHTAAYNHYRKNK